MTTRRSEYRILNNEAVIGIFYVSQPYRDAPSTVTLVLSPCGAYCMVSAEIDKSNGENLEYENLHLTKFVPTRFGDMAKKLVTFRNKFSYIPYLDERFNTELSDVATPR